MNGFARLVARTGPMAMQQLRKHSHSQVKILTTRRSTSWMPFEGPNPSLYTKIYGDASRISQAAAHDAERAQGSLRNKLEIETTATGKMVSQDQITRLSSATLDNSHQTITSFTAVTITSPPTDSRFLCTTLVKIPGCPATWSCEQEDVVVVKSNITSATVAIIKPPAA